MLSSRIEGTRDDPVRPAHGRGGVAPPERDPSDLREVRNYVDALEYGLARLSELPLSLRSVRELHERLMQGVRGAHMTPGEFRWSQNWIGPPGVHAANATYRAAPR